MQTEKNRQLTILGIRLKFEQQQVCVVHGRDISGGGDSDDDGVGVGDTDDVGGGDSDYDGYGVGDLLVLECVDQNF